MHVQLSSGVRGLSFGLCLIYVPTLCIQAAEALARLCISAGSSEPLLPAYTINTKIFVKNYKRAQWLSVRMLDSRSRGLWVRASPTSLCCVST